MKKNIKGFAISGLLYPILILTLFLVVQVLFMLQTRKNVLDKSRTELADSVNKANQIYTIEELSTIVDELKSKQENLYPVGSIYIGTNNTNPSNFIGGTWETYGSGRTLVGMDTGQSEFNTIGKTGGTKTHTLTVNEMPSHNHTIYNDYTKNTLYFGMNIYAPGKDGPEPGIAPKNGGFEYGQRINTFVINNTGGNQPHNNLQPYITVYMWRRTA